jgi:peptide/nickel transport system ATP-binding protein
MTSLLTIEDLYVSYTARQGEVAAVRGITLRSDGDEIIGLVGQSGSGKSTIGLSIGRLLPTGTHITGSLRVLGKDVPTLNTADIQELRRRHLAYVFQNPISALDPTMKIGRQFDRALGLVGRPAGDAPEELRRVNLEEAARVLASYPHELSGGMAQRVAIALALVGSPQLVIADEPTSSLDADLRARVLEVLISRVRAEHGTLLLLSHDLRSVQRWCDRIVVLHDGRLVEEGATSEVFAHPSTAHTRELLESATGSLRAVKTGKTADRAGLDAPAPVPVMELAGVTVRFRVQGRAEQRAALNGIDLVIRQGQTLGLVGRSGSGKSTIARVAVGLVRPSAGTVRFEGRHMRPAGPWSRGAIQAVFQHPEWNLNPRRTVELSVSEPLAVAGKGAAGRRAAVADALGAVRLPASLASRFPHELSGGQRQRVAIARALIAEPRFVVFDEVTSALDASVQKEILALIADLQADRRFTALFISHDLGAVLSVADQIAVVHDGRIVEHLPAARFTSDARHEQTLALMKDVM